MDLGADVVGDQAQDPLGVGGRSTSGPHRPGRIEAVDPDPAIGIEHDLFRAVRLLRCNRYRLHLLLGILR
jgi:hypothetical protein